MQQLIIILITLDLNLKFHGPKGFFCAFLPVSLCLSSIFWRLASLSIRKTYFPPCKCHDNDDIISQFRVSAYFLQAGGFPGSSTHAVLQPSSLLRTFFQRNEKKSKTIEFFNCNNWTTTVLKRRRKYVCPFFCGDTILFSTNIDDRRYRHMYLRFVYSRIHLCEFVELL